MFEKNTGKRLQANVCGTSYNKYVVPKYQDGECQNPIIYKRMYQGMQVHQI